LPARGAGNVTFRAQEIYVPQPRPFDAAELNRAVIRQVGIEMANEGQLSTQE